MAHWAVLPCNCLLEEAVDTKSFLLFKIKQTNGRWTTRLLTARLTTLSWGLPKLDDVEAWWSAPGRDLVSLVCCDSSSGPVIDQSWSYPFTLFQAGRKSRKCRKQIAVFQLQVNETCRAQASRMLLWLRSLQPEHIPLPTIPKPLCRRECMLKSGLNPCRAGFLG